jgi:flap endonuclease-1
MGIDGLGPFLRHESPGAFTQMRLTAGMTIFIDASIMIYSHVYIGEKFNIVGTSGEPINHIISAAARLREFIAVGCRPILIFDGAPPDAKAAEMVARAQARERGALKVPRCAFDDIKALAAYMGVSVISSDGEAEALGSRLVAAGAGWAIATDDLDSLAFGSPRVITGIEIKGKISGIIIDLATVLKELELTYEQFVDFCVLCGSDYQPRVAGMGPKTAIKLIKKYKTLDDIARTRDDIGPGFFQARDEFLRPRVTIVPVPEPSQPLPSGDFAQWLTSHGIQSTRISKILGNKIDSV